MSIVQEAMQALKRNLGSDFRVSFTNTGGGCMAIEVTRGDREDVYVLITEAAEVFTSYDWRADEYVSGFYATLNFGEMGTPESDPVVLFVKSAEYVGNDVDPEHEDCLVPTADGRREVIRGFIPGLVDAVSKVAEKL